MPDVDVFEEIAVSDVGDIRQLASFIRYNAAGHYLEWWVDGQEIARFRENGDLDLNGTKVPSAF